MKLVLPYAFAALLAASTPAFAQSAFDGVWKVDLGSAQLSDRPFVVSLADGTYTCTSCVPNYSVPADGRMHRVEGFDYWDEISVRIVDAHTVEDAQRLKGRSVGSSRSRVSDDGAALTVSWTDTSAPDGATTRGENTYSRIAPGPAGAHALSGSWRSASVSNVSDATITATISLADGVFNFASGDGYKYSARLGGPAAPITGDLAGATATVRQLADGSIEETDHVNGEARSVMTLTPQADGSILIKVHNLKTDTHVSYRTIRQ